MTDQTKTAVGIVIDRSGSMSAIKTATQEGLDEFFNARRTDPSCALLHVVQFDTEVEVVHSGPAAEFPAYVLAPRGMTALHQAICQTVDALGAKLAAMPENERPANVLMAIMTDGHENASGDDFPVALVKEKITHQGEKYGWQFLYLGANQDAVLVGGSFGINRNQTMSYAATDSGTGVASEVLRGTYAVASAGGPVQITDEQRRQATE